MTDNDFPMQQVTIYHKLADNAYERYNIEASFRNTTSLNHSKNEFSSTDTAIIRVFDIENYNTDYLLQNAGSVLETSLESFIGDQWEVSIGDIVVNGEVDDDIKGNTPITQLREKYGKNNVYKVNSISRFIFDDIDLKELNHIKIGAI